MRQEQNEIESETEQSMLIFGRLRSITTRLDLRLRYDDFTRPRAGVPR